MSQRRTPVQPLLSASTLKSEPLEMIVGRASSSNHLAQTWIEQEEVIELLDSDVEMLDVAPLKPIQVTVQALWGYNIGENHFYMSEAMTLLIAM